MQETHELMERAKQVFAQALATPPADRAAFIAEACGSEAALRAEVESLIHHHQQAEQGFMQSSHRDTGDRPASLTHDTDEMIDQKVGQYRIKRVIGSGGMGTVYLAEQDHPRRKVALKIMNVGIASRSSRKRFEYESHVLAQLRHPNIAQVFEAGTHELISSSAEGDSGVKRRSVPFFAMEYIPDARTITQYADEVGLNTRERLGLLATVCEAIQHGHKKGIIHRDLKPANILLDAEGRVKVIDFGVARSTDSDVAITTQRTHLGQILGTLQYMSPEQLEANPDDLDARSDVYSLGVVLYELLCGKLPYDVTQTPLHMAARLICEEPPVRLSSIDRKLRGDLEIIALKALEKDRERRYGSAAALASDIRRYLQGAVIEARSPTLTYLVGKYVRSHKWKAASLALGAVCVMGFLITLLIWNYWQDASDAKKAAEAAERRSKAVAFGASMAAAEAALQMNDAATAREILRATEDKSSEWGWRHLWSRVDQSVYSEEIGRRTLHLAIARNGSILGSFPNLPFPTHSTLIYRAEDIEHGNARAIPLPPGLRRVRTMAFSADGCYLAASGKKEDTQEHVLTLWKLDTSGPPECLAQWKGPQGVDIPELAIHVSRGLLAGACTDRTIKVWDIGNLARFSGNGSMEAVSAVTTLEGHDRVVLCLSFSPDGQILASGSFDHTIRLWKTDALFKRNGESHHPTVLAGHTDHVTALAFSADGKRLASGSVDKTIHLWDIEKSLAHANSESHSRPSEMPAGVISGVLIGHDAMIYSVAFNEEGTRLASGSGDNTVRVWDVRERAPVSDSHKSDYWLIPKRRKISQLRGHSDEVACVAWLPNERLISASQDGTAKIWEPDTDDVAILREHNSSVWSVSFDPQGQYVMSGGADGCISVWDTELCTPIARLFLQNLEMVHDLACWTREEHTFLAAALIRGSGGAQMSRVVICDLSPEGHPHLLSSFNDAMGSQRFSAVSVNEDATRLAVNSVDGMIRVFSVEDPGSPSVIGSWDGTTMESKALVFLDARGEWLVFAGDRKVGETSRDHLLCVQNVDGNSISATYTGHFDVVTALAISPDGGALASASLDKTIRIWSIEWNGSVPHIKPRESAPVLRGHTGGVISVVFASDSNRLFSGAEDRTIKLWDLATGANIATLRGQLGDAMDLAFSRTGERLASASRGMHGFDNVVRLWEATRASPAVIRQRAVLKRAWNEVQNVFRHERVSSLGEAKSRLESNERLPRAIRDRAIEDFELLLPHPDFLYMLAENALLHPGLESEEYAQALVWARTAGEMAPENGGFCTAIGLLQYRLGRFTESLKTILQAKKLNIDHRVADWALLAMVHHRLGNAQAADEALAGLHFLGAERPESYRYAEDMRLAEEAELLLGRGASP